MNIQETNLKSIADAIRDKDGSTDPIKASDFANRILAIQTGVDTSDATATADKILSGKTLYVNGEKVTGTLIPIEKPEWITGTMPVNTSWSSICYGAGKFVAVGLDTPVYSTDGINWSKSNATIKENWTSVCYGADKFIAVARNGAVAYSLDGINWTFCRLGPIMGTWNSVCYYDGGFEVIGQGGSDEGDPACSKDGIEWNPDSLLFYADNWTLAYGKGTLVAVADSSPECGAIYSNESTKHGFREAHLTKNKNWSSVCYGNGKFVAVEKDSNTAAYSEDGISWTLT